jgi:predicted aspartyl protease
VARLLRCFALSLALTLCGAIASRGQPSDASSSEATELTVQTDVSQDQRMLAPVMIAGAGPYPFIVDTAAERSVVSRELVDALALQPAGSARLLSMTSSHATPMVMLPRASFVAGRERGMRVFALNGGNIGAAGVLGIDALQDQRVVLDFETGEMRLTPSPRRPVSAPTSPEEIIVNGRRRFGELVLIDSDAGGAPVDVIVDTGLDVSVGNEALRRLLAAQHTPFTEITLVAITGEAMHADYTTVDRLRVGGLEIKGMPVAFADAYFFRRMDMTRRPALMLGMDVLRAFRRVTVDFPNHHARFLLPTSTAQGN